MKTEWAYGLILFLSVLAIYSPMLWAGYIWDDDLVVTSNPCIVGPLGIKEIWTTSAADICPLTLSTFWLEHLIWGLTPGPYHFVNILLHGASTIVLWRVLRTLSLPGAWLGAALWALHPIEVESVAWIAEMKNTESGLFFLLAILFFLKWFKSRDPNNPRASYGNYAWMLLFSFLAMASKSSTVVLPVVFCLCAWWIDGRWNWRNLLSTAPMFGMSLAAAAVSIWTQSQQVVASSHAEWIRTWPERLSTAGDVVWFYLWKIIWPYPLINIYPRWQIDSGQWTSYLPSVAVMIVLFVLWLKRASWSRPYFFAFSYFFVVLLPVLGLVTMTYARFSFVADHFQYLATMGPLALIGAGIARAIDFAKPVKSWLRPAIYAGVLLVCGLLSWNRAWAFENKGSIWSDTLRKNPTCWTGFNNMGDLFLGRGDFDKAIFFFRKAIALNPRDELAHNNLGVALSKSGRTDEAMVEFRVAMDINPNYSSAHINLGNYLTRKGQLDEAVAEYNKAVAINPNLQEGYNNLGNTLLRKGQTDEAIIQFKKALAIDPHLLASQINLGNALVKSGHADEAIPQFQTILKSNPKLAEVHAGLANAYLATSQIDEAIAQFQSCLATNPTDAVIYNSLGKAYLQKGERAEAVGQFQAALRMKPDYQEAQANLANAQKPAKK